MAEAGKRSQGQKTPKRTKADIREVYLLDEGPFYNFGDSAIYIGMSEAGFRRWRERHPGQLKPWNQGIGNEVYFLKSDLDELLKPRPAEE